MNHYPDMLVGYARVPTLDQNLDLQRDALTKARRERLFEEMQSGKASTNRHEFDAAPAYMGPTDVLVICKLDRLVTEHLALLWQIDGTM